MKEEIACRRLISKESKAYRALRLESLLTYPDSFGSLYEEQQQREKLAFERFIEEAHPENFIVGACYQEEVLGICGFYRLQDVRCRHRGEIIQMYVKPAYQGNMIGFRLLQQTLKEAFAIEGLEQIELQVMTHILSANKVYEKVGFKECGIQKGFYKKQDNYFDQRNMILHRADFLN
ncbi:MAG: GNAT family N-acetyltransferase [Bacteroidota bacterium]